MFLVSGSCGGGRMRTEPPAAGRIGDHGERNRWDVENARIADLRS